MCIFLPKLSEIERNFPFEEKESKELIKNIHPFQKIISQKLLNLRPYENKK